MKEQTIVEAMQRSRRENDELKREIKYLWGAYYFVMFLIGLIVAFLTL